MLQGSFRNKNNMLYGRQILIRPEFVLMSLRKVSSIILFLCITVSLHAEISFSTDDEAILYVNLTEGDAVLDTFQIVPIAADRKINAAQIVNASSRKYLFLEVYLGTPGGYQTINKVDLLVFDISDNSLNLIETITLTETVYNGKTKSYSSYKDISYFYNADTDTILLFREEDGTFIEQQTIPLSE